MARLGQIRLEGGLEAHCLVPADLALQEGDQCIVEINRVPEFGVLQRLVQDDESPSPPEIAGVVLRRATLQDRSKAAENAVLSKMARDACETYARKIGLDLQLIEVHYSFDRSVLRVLFATEKHADTREVAKKLSTDLRTRVEMRQIGVRDRAAIVGGIGPCGRKFCCATWLKQFDSVNVKMAKVQRLSLNPSSIGGGCARLKCCLRFEYELYQELTADLPRQGSQVVCPEGSGTVIGVDILRRRVRIRLTDERVFECDANKVRCVAPHREPETGEEDESTLAEWAESQSPGDT